MSEQTNTDDGNAFARYEKWLRQQSLAKNTKRTYRTKVEAYIRYTVDAPTKLRRA